MIPVQQTQFEEGAGNSLDACVATLLELPLDRVPHFNGHGARWMVEMNRFLGKFGFAAFIIEAHAVRSVCWPIDGYSIACGQSSHGLHAVVWKGSEMVHDPHPDGEGLAGPPMSFTLLCALDPSRRKLRRGRRKD